MALQLGAVNKKAQKEGVWVKYSGSELLIASMTSPAYQRRMNALRKPFIRQIDNNTVDPEDINNILATGLSEYILLNWKGVLDEKGNEVPFSVELAKQLLLDDIDLQDFVVAFSDTQANYEREYKETVVKK